MQARRYILVCMLLLPVVGCADSSGPPPGVVGSYRATSFTFAGAVTGDVLAAAGSLTILLAPDSSTTGRLFVPASLAGGADFEANMAGRFTVRGDTVRFTQDADTFVRDMVWINRTAGQLVATGSFSGTTIDVILTRTP